MRVLARLRHDAIVERHHEQRGIDAAGAGQHRVHEALVARDVDEAQRAVRRVGVGVAEIDGDAAPLLLGQAIGVDAGQRLHQRGLAVVDVAGCADDHGAWLMVMLGVRRAVSSSSPCRRVRNGRMASPRLGSSAARDRECPRWRPLQSSGMTSGPYPAAVPQRRFDVSDRERRPLTADGECHAAIVAIEIIACNGIGPGLCDGAAKAGDTPGHATMGTPLKHDTAAPTRRIARPPGHHRQPQGRHDAALASRAMRPVRRETARAAARGDRARAVRWSRRPHAGRAAGRTDRRRAAATSSTSATGSANPARCSSAAQSRRSANGETRGAAPPVSTASASVKACRSSPSVPSAGRLASSNPSGRSARRNWISAPGRSLTQCSDRLATTRSKLPAANGRNSSSAATAIAAVQRRHRRREIAAHHVDAARAQQRRDHAAAADIQRAGETARHVIQPVEQALRRSRAARPQRCRRAARHGRGGGAPRGGRTPPCPGPSHPCAPASPALPSIGRRA